MPGAGFAEIALAAGCEALGLPARNARADADALGKFVLDLLEPKITAKV